MRNFKQWFTERFPKENLPSSMSGKWFAEHGLPMIVSCTCCQTTMTLPSALIGGDNDIFCHDCAGDDEEDEEGEDKYTLDDLGPNWYQFPEPASAGSSFYFSKPLDKPVGSWYNESLAAIFRRADRERLGPNFRSGRHMRIFPLKVKPVFTFHHIPKPGKPIGPPICNFLP